MASVAVCVGGECASLRTRSPWCTKRVRFHVYWLDVTIAPFCKKSLEGSLTAPDDLCPGPKGAGGSEWSLLDKNCDSSESNGYAARSIGPEAVESSLSRRAVPVFFSCFTGAEGARRRRSGYERGSADPCRHLQERCSGGGQQGPRERSSVL